jgi:molybdate transport system substrate-binding protein
VKPPAIIVPVLVATLSVSACSTSGNAGTAKSRRLTVGAAASLSHVFPEIGKAFEAAHPGTGVQFSFAGTDAIVAQIEQGAPMDVFAGASASYGDGLASKGLIDPPVPFCSNSLVLVLPADDPAGISSLDDLTRSGIKLVIGADTVPIGSYTRKVLANLDGIYGAGYSSKVLANVVSNEDNVEGVITKVRLGEADAGFVYVTDSKNAGSSVKSIELPSEAQAMAVYPIAVVRASLVPDLARDFVAFVMGYQAQGILRSSGFQPPPLSE